MLDVLADREKATVVAWLTAARKSGLLSALAEVTCDMTAGYANAAREVFGEGVRVVVDRYHVMALFHRRLTEARRAVQDALLPPYVAPQLKCHMSDPIELSH